MRAHTSVFRRRSSDTRFRFSTGISLLWPHVARDATESVRCRPRTTRGGEPAVVRTAMTRTPMGPHWPGHSLTRELNESSPGVSPVPSECGLEPNGNDRPNPMVGLHVLQGVEEVKPMNCPNCKTELEQRRLSETVSRWECPHEECGPKSLWESLRSFLPSE